MSGLELVMNTTFKTALQGWWTLPGKCLVYAAGATIHAVYCREGGILWAARKEMRCHRGPSMQLPDRKASIRVEEGKYCRDQTVAAGVRGVTPAGRV